MLLPIGQEDSTVRRQPWVSYALIAVNFLVFLAVGATFDEGAYLRELQARWERVAQYLAEHPYLDPPPQVSELLGEDFAGELAAARREHEEASEIPDAAARHAEQAQLKALVAEALAAREGSPYHRWGHIPARGGFVTALSALFVHAGWLHLVGNMLFFFLSGPFIEDVYGRPLFGALYLVAGLVATFAHGVKFPASDVPLVGASGAIAGIMGAFLVRLGRSRIQFLYMPFFPFFWRIRLTFFLPAFVVLPLWFGEQVFYAHTAGAEAGVGWWAHIGGFALGVLAALAIKLSAIEERFVAPVIEKQIAIVQHPGLEAALDARTRGDWATARAEIRKVLAAEPSNPDAWAECFEIALGSGDRGESGRSAVRLLELLVTRGEKDLAHQFIFDAQDRLGEALPARFYLSAAGFLEREGDARSALDVYERLVGLHPTDPASLRALFRRGEILRKGGDLRGAREAYARARQHPGWNEQMRQVVERALAEAEGRPPKRVG